MPRTRKQVPPIPPEPKLENPRAVPEEWTREARDGRPAPVRDERRMTETGLSGRFWRD
jgi:hypothetical protein